jgi:hypothetical protein
MIPLFSRRARVLRSAKEGASLCTRVRPGLFSNQSDMIFALSPRPLRFALGSAKYIVYCHGKVDYDVFSSLIVVMLLKQNAGSCILLVNV